MTDETRYVHKPCGAHVLTKRGEPWRTGEMLLREDVLWQAGGLPKYGAETAFKCPNCGGRVAFTSLTENGMIPEADQDG